MCSDGRLDGIDLKPKRICPKEVSLIPLPRDYVSVAETLQAGAVQLYGSSFKVKSRNRGSEIKRRRMRRSWIFTIMFHGALGIV